MNQAKECSIIHLISADRMNRLTLARGKTLTVLIEELTEASRQKAKYRPLILTGNDEYSSSAPI